MKKKPHSAPEQLAKAQLIQYFLKKQLLKEDVVLINELSLESFSRRADLVLVNGSIDLFEIKSEADSLVRLNGQIETFTKFCDKLHIVVAECHAKKVLSLTSEKTAVWQLNSNGEIKILRKGKKSILLDKKNLLQMINISELRKLLTRNKIKPIPQRRKFMDIAALELDSKIIRQEVLQLLKERYVQDTKKILKSATAGNQIRPKHLAQLKRRKTKKHIYKNADTAMTSEFDDIHLQKLANETKEKIFGSLPKGIIEALPQN